MSRDLRTPHPLQLLAEQLAELNGSSFVYGFGSRAEREEARRQRRVRKFGQELKRDLDYGRG